jgi:hypothetical protein
MAMADPNPLAERGRSLEEDYFRKRDRELLERMRAAAAADEARKQLGSVTGLEGADVDELRALGFTPDTISLLPIVPLLQVAWAEGGVSAEERTLIVQLARSRGIEEGSAADAQLTRWMSDAPPASVFAGATRLVNAMIDVPGSTAGGLTRDELVAYCERVAAASGGFLGMKKISAEERALITSISQDLKKRP